MAFDLLRDWVDEGVLVPMTGRGKRNMVYVKPQRVEEGFNLLSGDIDNNADK